MFTKDVIAGIMATLYETPMSLEHVSDKFNCSAMTVRKWLLKNGYKVRPKGRIPGSVFISYKQKKS